MARDPVLMHAAAAADAERRYGIPASVLLGLLSVEGGTDANGRPVAPGDGAGPASYGQFTFATGRSLGIKYGDSASEVDGVARYLVQLGYRDNPQRAIGAYNGGPGNPQMGYAAKVLAAAKSYVGFDGDGTGTPTASPTTTPSDDGRLVDAGQHSQLVKFGVAGALVLAAVAAIATGISRATGVGAHA